MSMSIESLCAGCPGVATSKLLLFHFTGLNGGVVGMIRFDVSFVL
jgi:uncharacterized membrane protein YuzA (DUF378 family)